MNAEWLKSTKTWCRASHNHSFTGVIFFVILFFTFSFGSSLPAVDFFWGQPALSKKFLVKNNDRHLFEPSHSRQIVISADKTHLSLQRLNLHAEQFRYAYNYTTANISFDKKANSVGINDSFYVNNATILQSNVKLKKIANSINEAASFEKPSDQIWLRLPDFLFLNQSKTIGNFSIFFRIFPYKLSSKMEVLRKIGLYEGNRYGFSCHWQDGRLVFEFINLFHGENGTEPLIGIATKDSLRLDSFQNVLLQYDENSGAMSLYLNGVEQAKKFITVNRKNNATLLNGHFHKWDQSPFIIGSTFTGAIDEMLLSNELIDPHLESGHFGKTQKTSYGYAQTPGIFLSKRYQLPYSASQFAKINFISQEPATTQIKYYFRVADLPFAEDTPEHLMPFQSFSLSKKKDSIQKDFGQKNSGQKEFSHQDYFLHEQKNFAKGRYFQLKFELFASHDGQHSPSLHAIYLNSIDNLPPKAPQGLEVASNKNLTIQLSFLRNAELDVINQGRYHIYYGVEPYKPLGVIRFKQIQFGDGQFQLATINDSDLFKTSNLQKQNRVQVSISNQLIERHIHWASKNPHRQWEYPYLQKDVPFFFWVTACDNHWQESAEYADHESPPSNYVVVRPQE